MIKETKIHFSERFVITVIDIIFYIMVMSLLSFVFTGEVDNLPNSVNWISVCVYVLLFHCYLNQTPGMLIFGYRFVSLNLQKPLFWKMILRWLSSFLFPIILIGAIVAVLTFNSESGFYWDRWLKVKMVKELS